MTKLYHFIVLQLSVSKIDPDILVGRWPKFATIAGTSLYVLSYYSSTVSVIDTATGTKKGADIFVGGWPKSASLLGSNLLIACKDGLYLMHLDRLEEQLRAAATGVAPRVAFASTWSLVNTFLSNSLKFINSFSDIQ